MEEQEKQRLFEIAGKYEDCVYIEVSSVQSGSTLYTTWEMLWEL